MPPPSPSGGSSSRPTLPIRSSVEEQLHSIDSWLQEAVERKASDLHLAVGAQPAIRVRGAIELIPETPKLDPDSIRTLLYRLLTTEQQKRFELDRQIDLTYAVPGVARFRLNV